MCSFMPFARATAGKGRDLAAAIGRAELRRLRDADRAGLWMMHGAFLEPGERGFDNHGCELCVWGLQSHKLRAMGEELHRTAFVDSDMAACVAKDCAV